MQTPSKLFIDSRRGFEEEVEAAAIKKVISFRIRGENP